MSSRTFHYREAERLLAGPEGHPYGPACGPSPEDVALAQAHATLATVSIDVEEHARAIECRAAERAEFAEGNKS